MKSSNFSTWAVAQATKIYGAGTTTAATLMAELTDGYEYYTDDVCKCSPHHPKERMFLVNKNPTYHLYFDWVTLSTSY